MRAMSCKECPRHIVTVKDFIFNDVGRLCLLVRFKNCTGNVIELDDIQHDVTETEFAEA